MLRDYPQFVSTPVGLAQNYGYCDENGIRTVFYVIVQNDRAIQRDVLECEDMVRAVRKAFMYS